MSFTICHSWSWTRERRYCKYIQGLSLENWVEWLEHLNSIPSTRGVGGITFWIQVRIPKMDPDPQKVVPFFVKYCREFRPCFLKCINYFDLIQTDSKLSWEYNSSLKCVGFASLFCQQNLNNSKNASKPYR